MAEGSILPKLEAALRRPIKTEMQVVYILVELRKLLEHKNKKDAYPALNFYGNWVVHTKLSSSAVADRIIRLFDEHLYQVTQMGASGPWEEIQDILSDVPLQKEMTEFLKLLNLPTSICTSSSRWFSFRLQLSKVIEDSPLMLKPGSKMGPTHFIEALVVENHSSGIDKALNLRWKHKFHTHPLVHKKDGKFLPRSQWPSQPPSG